MRWNSKENGEEGNLLSIFFNSEGKKRNLYIKNFPYSNATSIHIKAEIHLGQPTSHPQDLPFINQQLNHWNHQPTEKIKGREKLKGKWGSLVCIPVNLAFLLVFLLGSWRILTSKHIIHSITSTKNRIQSWKKRADERESKTQSDWGGGGFQNENVVDPVGIFPQLYWTATVTMTLSAYKNTPVVWKMQFKKAVEEYKEGHL